jgi:hypothetical protein
MSTPWIDGAYIGMSLQTQASSMATRLGHRMTGWAPTDDKETFVARCVHCDDSMVVSVRKFRAAPIKGAAVSLHCRKMKKAA